MEKTSQTKKKAALHKHCPFKFGPLDATVAFSCQHGLNSWEKSQLLFFIQQRPLLLQEITISKLINLQ